MLTVLGLAAPQAGCTPQFAPLHTGTSSSASVLPYWRKEQADDWGGDGWLGWTYDGKALVPVMMAVRDLPMPGAADDDHVTVEAIPDVVFAVRCFPRLRPGPIRSAGVVNHSLTWQRVLRVRLGERRYQVRLESRRDDLSDAVVVLTDGRRRQTLFTVDGFADDPRLEVEWAGDLDRDGRLDLVVILSHKYTMLPHHLLLSSKAATGQLVGEAAVFEHGD